MPIEGKFYTAVEVGEIYKVDFRSVLRWIRDGKLKAIRVLQGYLIPQWALDEFDKLFGGRSKSGRPRKAPLHDPV